MKKAIVFALVTAVLLSACGCGGKLAPNTVNSENDLASASIGVVENSSAAVFTADYGTVKTYASPGTLLFDLRNGALDCAVLEKFSAKSAMKEVGGLKILKELVRAELCFAVAKENPDLREAVNSALYTLRDNGVLKKMADGYFGGKDYRYVSPEGVDRSRGTLTLAVDGKLWPYSYDDGDGSIVGFDVDLARAVCDLLGVDMTVAAAERKDLLINVQIGKADFSLGCIYANETDLTLVDFTDSYADCTQVIVVRR